MKKGIAIAGSLILDKHYLIDDFPIEGTLSQVKSTDMSVGGICNLAIDLAKIDSSLAVDCIGLVGDDASGTYIKKYLAQFHSITINQIQSCGKTSETIVLNSHKSKERTFFHFTGVSDIFSEEHIDFKNLNCSLFLLEYLMLLKTIDSPDPEFGTIGARILAKVQSMGIETCIDMVSHKKANVSEIVKYSLKYCDYFCVNEYEAFLVSQIDFMEHDIINDKKIKNALLMFKTLGVKKWVVIHSSKVSYGLDCKTMKYYKVKSLALPSDFIKGKTGAGDAFYTGILYSAYKNQTLAEAICFATATAACSLSHVGSTEGLRSFDKVMEIYNQYKGEKKYEEI